MKGQFPRAISNNRGGALLIVLAIMMMLLIAAMTAVDTAQTDIELSFNQLHSDQAFYVAEAGLKSALIRLIENNTWDTGFAAETFEEGVYSVAVVHTDVDSLIIDTVTLRSTAAVDRSVANLEAIVVPKLWYPFQFAMFGADSLQMINNTTTDSYNSDSGTYIATVTNTDGDVGSNGPIDLVHSAFVGGDAATADTGGLDVCAMCTVMGDTASGIAPYTIDPIPDSEFVQAHDFNSAPGGLSGAYTYDGVTHDLTLGTNDIVTFSAGVYFFNDINFGSNSQLDIVAGDKVTIYAAGDMVLQSNTSINPSGAPSDLIIYSKGSLLTVGMSIDIHAAFYGPDADISVGMGCDFYGAAIGKSAFIDNSATIHYDRALSDYPAGVTGEMVMIAWREM